MNNLFNRLFYVCAVFLMLIPLVSCGGGGGGGGGTAGTGTLSLGLTDAPGDYQHVWVTVKEIQVNKAATDETEEGEEGDDSGWLPAFTIEKTIDLKTLENGAIFDLGLAELEAGQYNQMRLILGTEPEPVELIDDLDIQHPHANYLVIEGAEEEEYVIGEEGEFYEIEELKVPSGFQTGIKIVKGFEIVDQGTTALILDFDANKSVVQAGNSGKWLLKPTIKVLDTFNNSISGEVNEGVDLYLLDALVSAQVYDSGAADPKDEVTVVGSASSDILGDYFMFLPLNTYNVVATADLHAPQCQEVAATGDTNYTANFTLAKETATITFSGTISNLDEATDTAVLSIRQHNFDCGGTENVTIEVTSDDFTNGSFSITIPAPVDTKYDLVASADGKITVVEEDIDVDTTIDIVFQPL